jgi:hypothetical protein
MKFVAVKVFDEYITAHVILGRLKEEDIVCHLENENTMTIAPFLTHIYGGIRLMVPEAQAERAKELLLKWENDQVS